MEVILRKLLRYAVMGFIAFFITSCCTRTVRLSLSQPRQQVEEQLKRIEEASAPPPNEGYIDYQYTVKLTDYKEDISNLLCALWELSDANTCNYLCVGDKKLRFDICPRYGGWASWRMMILVDVMKDGLILREIGTCQQTAVWKRKMSAEEIAIVLEEYHVEQVFLQIKEDANGFELFSLLRAICDKKEDIELYLTNWIDLDKWIDIEEINPDDF